MDLREFFTPEVITAHYEETQSNRIAYLGVSLFPARKKNGLDLRWLKGSKGLPVSLMPSAFDAKATFRDRIGVEVTETEMPFFREGFLIKERDRQELMRVRDANDAYATAVIDRVFDDSDNLIEGARVVPERMIWQLLTTGKITIQANGVAYDYDYTAGGNWGSTNVIKAAVAWSEADTADPFADLKKARDLIVANTGATLVRAVMTTATMNKLAKVKAVKERYLTTNGLSLGYLTDTEVAEVIRATSGFQIATYDKQYRDEAKTAHAFLPDDKVVLLPTGDLGNTWYGTTPEEADLMGGSTNAEVSVVNTGTAITRIMHEHPVNAEILASEIVLPSWERMDECVVLDVAGE